MHVVSKSRRWQVTAILATGLAVGASTAALAQDRAALLAGMKACLEKTVSTHRLACFEKLAQEALGEVRPTPEATAEAASPAATFPPAAAEAASTAPPAAPSQPAVKRTPAAASSSDDVRTRYGLRESKREEPKTLALTIVSAQPDRNGQWIFESADGQIWVQTDRRRVRLTRLPVPARIEKSFFGSYFLDLEGIAADIRVRRRK